VDSIIMASPAKLNLFLAVTGARPDGYHDLVSVAAPLAWGDTLHVRLTGGDFSIECDDPEVPLDESNLVLRAARAFFAATGRRLGAAFVLEKRIPVGAGLGGGSSNAVAALRALNQLAGGPLDPPRLESVAAELGSDCPLFLGEGPVVIRGRGERVENLDPQAARRLAGRRVLVLKPGFGISTARAYAKLDAAGGAPATTPPGEAEARLAAWVRDPSAPAERILFNSFEAVVFPKYPALPLLFERLRSGFGLEPSLSGSGSACFALVPERLPMRAEGVAAAVRDAWGSSARVVDTRIP
jgi:4-diphosphocytidyl-2-C-methyl-D-erythritol kinase